MPAFTQLIIIVNPVSTNASLARRHIEALHEKFDDSHTLTLQTTAKGAAAMVELLSAHKRLLGPRTLVVVAGGDGTVNTILSFLHSHSRLPSAARQAVVLPLWGGNANDMAYMLNGLSSRASTDHILAEGRVVPIHPLRIDVSNKGKRTSRLAMCYASFGASAYAARRFNHPDHRRKRSSASLPLRLVTELMAIVKAYVEAPVFQIFQNGKQTAIYEYLIVNGSRLSKVDWVPLKLSDKAYYHAAVQRKHPSILWYMYQAMRKHNYGDIINTPQKFTTIDSLPSQRDGEAFTVPPHSDVRISLAGRPVYVLSTKLLTTSDQTTRSSLQTISARLHLYRLWMRLLILVGGIHGHFHITNPYAQINIIKCPYTTTLADGQIVYSQNFKLTVLSGKFWSLVGYYKSGFLIVQNRFFGGRKAKDGQSSAIIAAIHAIRFDPSKPYLISGDQFSVLYVRNLGVFYDSLLNPWTALSLQDWQDRQRIYLQSVLYGLDGLSASRPIPTTLVPISPRRAIATQVHPGSVSSDSVYGLLYALHSLRTPYSVYPASYNLQTVQSAERILHEQQDELHQLVNQYLQEVSDLSTGLVRAKLKMASARDGVIRDRSFYDNVVLWKTLQLADELGILSTGKPALRQMRQTIIDLYWDGSAGHFRDSLGAIGRDGTDSQNYGSDWLIVLPTGFLDASDTDDADKLARSVAFIRQHGIAEPFPIKYQAEAEAEAAPWAVRTFVPNYGSNAIWSYWGAEYIKLLSLLYHATADTSYRSEAERHIEAYRQKIEQYRGFPESFDVNGNFLKNAVYQSIRQTGWVVAYEDAIYHLSRPDKH